MKFQRRKFAREYRKAGLPFIAAKRLAKVRDQVGCFWDVQKAMEKEGITAEAVTYCDCCGPEAILLEWSKGRLFLNYFDLSPR